MKAATCILILGALACLVHGTSAQQNWWERGPDGSTTIASSRTSTTVAPTPTPTTAASGSTTNCPCPVTPEYNPVCGDLGGDNRMTYDNPGMLECAQNCGLRVRYLFHGRCQKLS